VKPLTPNRYADTYDWCGPLIAAMVRAGRDPAVTQILDVGPCWGKYRYLLPEYRMMDACEIWMDYVVQEQLASMYRQVFPADICDHVNSPQWRSYDVVIMGDVFEHIGRDRAKPMLERVLDTCGEVIVAVPYLYEQGPEHGNPHQCHLQADLTPDLMAAEYPRLRLADTEWRGGRPFKGLYRS
jgi:hypothetical protein